MRTTKTSLMIAMVACLATAMAAPAFAQKKTTGEHVDDGSIAASIKAGLLDNKDTSSMQINVESYKGIAPKTSMGTKLDDTMITGKVKAALMDASDVKSMQINVETKNGVTQLAGFVTSQGMKDRAGEVAGAVSGVKQVDNVLVVKPKDK